MYYDVRTSEEKMEENLHVPSMNCTYNYCIVFF